jgi:predicted ATPase
VPPMIESIRIRNFKSLGEVTLNLEKFNCLIGMNGAGKSTVLQALDFIAQMMRGHIQGWLDGRDWSITDLNCKLRKESNITVSVQYRTSEGKELVWIGIFNRSSLCCTSESLSVDGEKLFQMAGQTYTLQGRPSQGIAFVFQGSLLSALKDSELLPLPSILEFRDAMRHVRSLELLSPQLLRKSARSSDKDIGAGGEKLAGYLHTIKGEDRQRLLELLKSFYPRIEDFKVKSKRAGWKTLAVIEQFDGQRLETEALHMSDGLLRILAVLAQAGAHNSLLLLDEIENGINQTIVEKLVDTLVSSTQQILVTTHSPLILNYLDDDLARRSVQFIYRTPQGESRIRHFFEIPRIGEKLRYMGPGEALVDTDLEQLSAECLALDEAGANASPEVSH